MKFPSGKRIGQSGQQLTTAVLFSFFLHAILFLAVLFLHFAVMPRISVPPFYAVKLVALPSEPGETPPSEEPPAAPKRQEKPAPPARHKAKKGAERKHKAADSLPDLAAAPAKKKPAVVEQEKPPEPQAAAARPSGESAAQAPRTDNVAVAAQQSDFKFGWYLDRVRSKIGQNWNPPPDARDARVRLVFSVNRSGWVGEVKLIEKDTIGTFQFQRAGIRAIHASNPFPPLPEEFSRQTLEFTVDLMAVE